MSGELEGRMRIAKSVRPLESVERGILLVRGQKVILVIRVQRVILVIQVQKAIRVKRERLI